MKILCVGNSFSEDTTYYVAEIATNLGFTNTLIANLYIGGCPIHQHYEHLKNQAPAYRYDRNDGTGWVSTPDYAIPDAVKAEEWDWIVIQHGSGYGSQYTGEDYYRHLPSLAQELRDVASKNTKIAFNLTWVGEPTYDHPEMVAFDRDQERLFHTICEITQRVVTPYVDTVCQTGTAVQNARTTALNPRLNRDGYHLGWDAGRYLAGLAFLRALTGASIDAVTWKPQGVSETDAGLILQSVNAAMEHPYTISPIA